MKKRKLIRDLVKITMEKDITSLENDKDKLNNLYFLKVLEELNEIKDAEYTDITEFADLLQVIIDFAKVNGFSFEKLFAISKEKAAKKGTFSNRVLEDLNPDNPSNKIYFS